MGAMKIYCVRIGDKYGQVYEDYYNRKLSDYEVIWVKKPIKPNIPLQWNKMTAMNDDGDEPVLVLDIDQLFINDYKKALDYPIEPGEFLACSYHWGKGATTPMSGGYYKFYPKEAKYIYETYMNDIDYWTNYYIKNGSIPGPVAGEFLYVYEQMSKKLKLKLLPDEWVARCDAEWPDQTFPSERKLVHFTHSLNKPHEWRGYAKYIQS